MSKKAKTKSKNLHLLITFISFFFATGSHANSEKTSKDVDHNCIVKFLVLDVGSSTTKSVLYTKDTCNNNKTIEKKTLNKNYPYQACLSDSKDNLLPKKCIEEGAKAIAAIKDHFQLDCETNSQCKAIATGWARNAVNINDWIDEVRRINVDPIIATQDHEGDMKTHAIKKFLNNSNQPFIAFDIGGGSFQLAWFDEKGEIQHYNSQYGTDNFTHDLQANFLSDDDQKCVHARNNITLLQNGDKSDKEALQNALIQQNTFCSPVSLTTVHPKELHKIINHADEVIGAPIRADKKLQDFIKKQKPVIYADSLLFSLGIKKQLGFDKDIITVDDVYKIMLSVSGMTYSQVKATHPNLPDICINTTQPSMLLLYSIMQSLKIYEIHMVQTDYMEHFVDSQIKK
jgi:hypothetical protein